MNPPRIKFVVGAFVAFCLVLLAGLLLIFQKGVSFATKTYEIRLHTSNVGGIKKQASVLMAGVPVGIVRDVQLDDQSKSVTLYLQIQDRYKISRDAIFNIEAAGFLGDQFISIIADKNSKSAEVLHDKDEATCREPLNIQEAARSALGLIQRMDRTVEEIHEAVARVDRTVLGDQNLTNLTATISNLRQASEQTKAVIEKASSASDKAVSLMDRASTTVDRASDAMVRLDNLVQTNTIPVNTAVTNFVQFAKQLSDLSVELKQTVVTNRAEFTDAIHNLDAATLTITNLLGGLETGKGLAGAVLKDEKLKLDMGILISNLTSLSSNINVAGSNLNTHGLWWLLWKPKSTVAKPAPHEAAH
jgi:ABC-type transporter Mla subunit MlaD